MSLGSSWWRRPVSRARTLRQLARDTRRALEEVADVLQCDAQTSSTIELVGSAAARSTALVILGCTAAARARLVHCLLGRQLFPDDVPDGMRWIRIQFGSSPGLQLTVGGDEFELLGELATKTPWETLNTQDLKRHDPNDLSTTLEVELNTPILKDGLKIIIPPDIGSHTENLTASQIKDLNPQLYARREEILANYNCVYVYAIDRIGSNIFSERILCNEMMQTRSEEDIYKSMNLYDMKSETDIAKDDVLERDGSVEQTWEPSVFSSENCVDLQQVKLSNDHSAVLFCLFSECARVSCVRARHTHSATESTESGCREELPESDRDIGEQPIRDCSLRLTTSTASNDDRRRYEEQIAFMNELLDQWEIMTSPPPKHFTKSQWLLLSYTDIMDPDHKSPPHCTTKPHKTRESCVRGCTATDRTVRNKGSLGTTVVKFAAECWQSSLLQACTRLSELHVSLVQRLVLASFDLARELQVLPRKIQYVATNERQLYETMTAKFSGQSRQQLVRLMQEVLEEMEAEIDSMDWTVDDSPCHLDHHFLMTTSSLQTTEYSQCTSLPQCDIDSLEPSDSEEAADDGISVEDYEVVDWGSYSDDWCSRVATIESSSPSTQRVPIFVENESDIHMNTMSYCTPLSYQSYHRDREGNVLCNSLNVSVKHASLEVQKTVLNKLSRKISTKLVDFVDCLKHSYFGTLQRCLQSLEHACRSELGGRPASSAMRQLLAVARQVDLQPSDSFSLLNTLFDSVRRFLYRLRVVSVGARWCCPLHAQWRRHTAATALRQLTATQLATLISRQILSRLSAAHTRYQSALSALQTALAARLTHSEDVKLTIRKKYAPSFARLCLESTSMCDLLKYGVPELGKEIGRGQYGVVYIVRGSWAGHTRLAVKSVLPHDSRHYHDLAMEFFYTRSIPPHPRIVPLLGAVVQPHAGGPAVLLVTPRKQRDLHAAVRHGLPYETRIKIAVDIVEGIRYLHSLGLVHRDIKLKNVLLDSQDRAALCDMGFCASEAMLTGSVVGTPVHMAPELTGGQYHQAVDVYAFGVLFWYLCAGDVRLPAAFETCQNKEQLWNKVRRGLRPEHLPTFSDECWEIMQSCWRSEPEQRALLGAVQDRLELLLEEQRRHEQEGPVLEQRLAQDSDLVDDTV